MFILAEIDTVFLIGNADQMICGDFTINALFESYGGICLPTAAYSGIAAVFCATFQRQRLLKLFKRLTVL